jgi:hypothetical protein
MYHAARKHRTFSELVSTILESRAVPATVVQRKTHRTLSDAMADDSDPMPDLAVSGAWIACTTGSVVTVGPFLDAATREAKIAGSGLPVAAVVYRQQNDRADALAVLTLDDLGRLLARVAEAEEVQAS